MILVEGEKYACVRCIRGHRSSTCQHTKRPLVQVRSRGRPNTAVDQRVTVFAETETEEKFHHHTVETKMAPLAANSSCCSSKKKSNAGANQTFNDTPKGCCNSQASEHQPVIVLKASRKLLYNVSKGSLNLLGPVDSSESEAAARIHNGKSTTCQGKVSKPCHKNTPKSSEALSRSSSSLTSTTEYMLQPIDTDREANTAFQPSTVYDLFYTKSCTLPGTCCCEADNCSCEGCSVHSPSVKQEYTEQTAGQMLHFQDLLKYNLDPTPTQDNTFGMTSQLTPQMTSQMMSQSSSVKEALKYFDAMMSTNFGSYDLMDDCSCLPDECACYNCPKHLIVDGIRLSDGVRVASPIHYPEEANVEYNNALASLNLNSAPKIDFLQQPLQNRTTITNLLFDDLSNEETIDLMEDCMCPPDDCKCVNCFKHGVFNNEVVNFETPAVQLVPTINEPAGSASTTQMNVNSNN